MAKNWWKTAVSNSDSNTLPAMALPSMRPKADRSRPMNHTPSGQPTAEHNSGMPAKNSVRCQADHVLMRCNPPISKPAPSKLSWISAPTVMLTMKFLPYQTSQPDQLRQAPGESPV